MNALQAHIEAENARTRELGYFGEVVSDPAHWAGYDIYTVEQYEHYMAKMAVWDMYKEVNGVRPRWMNLDDMSIEELEAELKSLCDEAQEQDELWDYQMEVYEQELEQEREEDRIEAELAPTKYELLAEQAGF